MAELSLSLAFAQDHSPPSRSADTSDRSSSKRTGKPLLVQPCRRQTTAQRERELERRALDAVCLKHFGVDVPRDLLSLISLFADEQYWCWDDENSGDCYEVSGDNCCVISHRVDTQGWQIALGKYVLHAGQKYSFSINLLQQGWVVHASLGVVPAEFCGAGDKKWMPGWKVVGGWEWWTNTDMGIRHCFESIAHYPNIRWCAGETMTVTLDFTHETMARCNGKGTMSFTHAGKDLGVACENIVPPVKLAVSTFSSGYKMEITDLCVFRPTRKRAMLRN